MMPAEWWSFYPCLNVRIPEGRHAHMEPKLSQLLVQISSHLTVLGAPLQTWFNFNLSLDK